MRRVKLDARHWWREDAGPLLATLKDSGRPVALLPLAGGGSYQIKDSGAPDLAQRVMVDKAVAAQLADDGYMFFRKFPAHDR